MACRISAAGLRGGWLVALVIGCTHCANAQFPVQTIALSGQAAPGISGDTFASFLSPAINESGQLTFFGRLAGADVTASNNGGIWSADSGALSFDIRKGDPAPGTGAGTFNVVNLPMIDGAGQIAFEGTLFGNGIDSTNNEGIWTGSPGSIQLAVRRGDAAPGTVGATFAYLGGGALVFSTSGEIGFNGYVTGGDVVPEDPVSGTKDNHLGIWLGSPGNLQIVIRQSEAAPTAIPGTLFASGSGRLTVNAAGQMAFEDDLTSSSLQDSQKTSVWRGDGASVQLLAHASEQAAGASAGVSYYRVSINTPDISATGHIVFQGKFQGTGVTTSNDTALWYGAPGAVSLVAREGDQAPGLPSGTLFGDVTSVPMINSSDQITFATMLTGPGVTTSNDTAIWGYAKGVIKPIIREGDPAPGLPAGVAIGDVNTEWDMIGSGQIAFVASLTGTGVTTTNDTSLWITDPNGNLMLLAREGDLFDVDNGPGSDLRTIGNIAFSNLTQNGTGEDGRRTAFNDFGEVAFMLGFTDGSSGIFVATVPEPILFPILMMTAIVIRRRRFS